MEPLTFGQAWRAAQQQLEAEGLSPAPQEGRALLAHATGQDMRNLWTQDATLLTPAQHATLQTTLTERLSGRPLAYVLGRAPFWQHDWEVTEAVLIPRPDSEILLATVLNYLAPRQERPTPLHVAEVGVGSGCLLGSVLLEMDTVQGVGTEISESALTVATRNFARHRLGPARAVLHRGNLLEPVPHDMLFDVVFSNPPYIAEADYAALEACVREHEPPEALTGTAPNADGLALYPKLIKQAAAHLVPGGLLAVEIGAEQGDAVQKLFREAGLTAVVLTLDLADRPRVVSGLWQSTRAPLL